MTAERERVAVPIALVIKRMEGYRDALTEHLKVIPWWQRRKRFTLIGARAAYEIEIEAARALLGGAHLKEDRP